jgi:polyhydroxybutyrate depolymerase
MNKIIVFSLTFLFTIFQGNLYSGVGFESFTGEKKIMHQELERSYFLHVPEGLKENAPLMVVIHGYTGSAKGIMDYSKMNNLADQNGFVIVYPQGTVDTRENTFFNVGYDFHAESTVDDVAYIRALVTQLQITYRTSSEKTFATGMSNGGDMSFLLACTSSDLFRAVAPIAGVMMKETLESCNPLRPIPIFEIHGTEDQVSLFEGDMKNEGGWGAYYDLPSTISFWVKQHKLTEMDSNQLDDKDMEDGSVITFDRHFVEDNVNEVWFYKVEGGTHTWPGWKMDVKWWKNPLAWYYVNYEMTGNNDIDTSKEVWSFFSKYTSAEE